MIRVIRTIRFDDEALRSDPNFLDQVGPGILVTFDIEQTPSFLVQPGSSLRIHRPDGTCIDRVVSGIEVFGPTVGLFFSNTEEHEIPISSQAELLA
jgi:hypothetical protein